MQGMTTSWLYIFHKSTLKISIKESILSLSKLVWFIFLQNVQQEPWVQQEHGLEGEGASNQSIIETNSKRKGRGPTKCLFRNTSKSIALPKTQVNKRDQPVGPGS